MSALSAKDAVLWNAATLTAQTCDYCGGKGTIVEKNTAGLIGTAVVVVAVIVIAAIVLF